MAAAPCCVGVVRNANALQGKDVTVGGAAAYLAKPSEGNKVGVLVIHDIFGFNIPNSKYIADHFAANNFQAALMQISTMASLLWMDGHAQNLTTEIPWRARSGRIGG
eukprot:gnl/MRDRNA2_/MRDRNA2_75954_c0_seq1.p2 gnl/MRDRNA2_/MRDRNA2_75954_c0~~gnl/MRDRNA2_/MRDRNA2_75954_c0_seq1.p2  ORF type:complete len:107 (+),score=25.70 gnl/MRDRNA2_/MRDRNA2_75954_c0_seq1:105-425(+)